MALVRKAVNAADTTLTDIYGVGPMVAALVIGYTGDPTRFASPDHYAAYNGTAPIEYSSGGNRKHRLSLRGNRVLNHAIHMAAVAQISKPTSKGWAYYNRKQTEGKTKKEALRALKRRISDTVYRQLTADQKRHNNSWGPGGTQERLCRSRGRLHILITGSSAQPPRATPKPTPQPEHPARPTRPKTPT